MNTVIAQELIPLSSTHIGQAMPMGSLIEDIANFCTTIVTGFSSRQTRCQVIAAAGQTISCSVKKD
ncbi:hypothetical protein [Lacticaseibacillus nasuensis]|uniref:hypothetical protein n=1 Tax=Lacticaseibacillus nasuensis TaxID=944671 RepID=UPI0006D1F849|nr:hypothetical protein [Lacticaseibacillus nasuensis]